MSNVRTDTADNSTKVVGKPFTKGDPRINRGGRPRNFDAARALALKIGNEPITNKDGSISMTRFEMIMRDWLTSNNFQKQRAVLELAFGKVPDEVNVDTKATISVSWDDAENKE